MRADSPQSANALRSLYALHRLDPDDALGEHAATFTLLGALRARLSLPVLPAPLRATAEAALEAEAVDALAREDLVGAAALVVAWAPEVEGAALSRVLRLVEAHTAAAAGRYGDAAALVEGVAAEEAGTAAHGELLALAAVFAERAGEAAPPGGVVAGGRGLEAVRALAGSAVPGTASLSVYPNPARGGAVVAVTLVEGADVAVGVYDVLGRRVAVLHEGALGAGAHALRLDAAGARLPAGVYVVRAVMEPEGGDARTLTERVTLVR